MTVDSAYFIKRYEPDNELVYRFFTESIGNDAMQVWLYTAPESLVQLTLGVDYTIEYDRSQEPTYKGGTITLVAPVPEGSQLSVQRLTPIVNDLTVESDVRFPADEFEYMMDKICFIQQEIEGSSCDCRAGCIPVTITQQPTVGQ